MTIDYFQKLLLRKYCWIGFVIFCYCGIVSYSVHCCDSQRPQKKEEGQRRLKGPGEGVEGGEGVVKRRKKGIKVPQLL